MIADSPGVAHIASGPLSSAELFVIINVPKRSTGLDANVPLRGVEATALQVRDQVKIVQGRMFDWGKNEVIVGSGAVQEFAGLEVGSKLKVGRYDWPVVGIFSANGGVAESEIWTDAKVLQDAYHRGDSFQSVYVKLNSPGAFQEFKDSLTSIRSQCEGRPAIRLLCRTITDHDAADHHAGVFDRIFDGRRRGVRRAEHDVQRGFDADTGDRHLAGARLWPRRGGRFVDA